MSWPRTDAGTLRCPCGKPGKIFTILSVYDKDGKRFGDFAGYCSEECKDWGEALGHQVPVFQTEEATAQEQPELF
jgi:hypothetical protein